MFFSLAGFCFLAWRDAARACCVTSAQLWAKQKKNLNKIYTTQKYRKRKENNIYVLKFRIYHAWNATTTGNTYYIRSRLELNILAGISGCVYLFDGHYNFSQRTFINVSMLFTLYCVSVISEHPTSGHTAILKRLAYCVLCPEKIALCKLLYFNIVEIPHTHTQT